MKANRKALHADDEAASVIVGGILLFAVTFLVLVMIQTNFVPVWQQNIEARQEATIRSQLAYLNSQAIRQVGDLDAGQRASPIDLNPSQNSIFSPPNQVRALLEVGEPNGLNLGLSAPELSVATAQDADALGVAESWDDVQGTGSKFEDVSRFTSLRLRFDQNTQYYEDEQAILTITDANNNFAGEFRITVLKFDTNEHGVKKAEFWVRSFDSNNELIWGNSFNMFEEKVPKGEEPDYAWIDAMANEFRFLPVIQTADGPVDVELTSTGGLPVEFSATYYRQIAQGEIIVGGGSELIPNFNDQKLGSRLTYQALNQYYVQQDLIVEYGAIIAAQGTSGAIISAPALSVATDGNDLTARWVVPNLVAPANSIAKISSGLVVTSASDHETLIGTGPSMSLKLETDYPTAWVNYFRTALESSDLTEGLHFTLDSDATSATLELTGPVNDGSHDVTIALQTATVEVVL